ncbi:MAG: hypothetical protein ACI8RD_007215 [Bacillariaceae sp.]|jgi:hypothetical protein
MFLCTTITTTTTNFIYLLARTDVHRMMVTVSISFSAPNEIMAQNFQMQVVEHIRIAISNGSFTKILDDINQ